MDGLAKDLRYAARSLIVQPGFTVMAVFTLALGVGATTAMFSAVNSVLLRPLPYDESGNVVIIKQTDQRDGSIEDGISAANMRDLAASATTLSDAAIAHTHGFTLLEEGRAISLRSWLVTDGFFEAIGGRAILGRTFHSDEFEPGQEKVVVLSHATWQGRFAGSQGIIGQSLNLDGATYTVIGVLPPRFKYPSAAAMWAPRLIEPWDDEYRRSASMEGVARLAAGVSPERAQAELDQLARDLREQYPTANANLGLQLLPLRKHLFGDVELPLLLLLGAVGLVLLIASANIAGLQLARSMARSREYALRTALGASRARILQLVGVESLLLALLGGSMGLAAALFGVGFIRRLGPQDLPRMEELSIDWKVLAFALGASLGSALVAGVGPSLWPSKTSLRAALDPGSRGSSRGPKASRTRDRLVVAEIAMALVLSIGAGLMVRSYTRLMDNELGFDPEGRLAVQVFAYGALHQPDEGFFRRSLEEIGAVPGVKAVGLTTFLPLADDQALWSGLGTTRFLVRGNAVPALGDEATAGLSAIDSNYARAMGIQLRSGRGFSTDDGREAAPVALVNEAFVRHYLRGGNAVGEQLQLFGRESSGTKSPQTLREIVGVLKDVRSRGFEVEPQPEIYLPLPQSPSGSLTFVVDVAGNPASVAGAVEEAIWTASPGQAIWASLPMTDLASDWVRQRSFNTALLVAFAILASSLAMIGIYGLMSFSVELRLKELSIRRALGGQDRDILNLVLRDGLKLALRGTGLGLLGAMAVTQWMRGMLFGIDPFDPVTFLGLAALIISLAGLAACWPAHRATRVEAIQALRAD